MPPSREPKPLPAGIKPKSKAEGHRETAPPPLESGAAAAAGEPSLESGAAAAAGEPSLESGAAAARSVASVAPPGAHSAPLNKPAPSVKSPAPAPGAATTKATGLNPTGAVSRASAKAAIGALALGVAAERFAGAPISGPIVSAVRQKLANPPDCELKDGTNKMIVFLKGGLLPKEEGEDLYFIVTFICNLKNTTNWKFNGELLDENNILLFKNSKEISFPTYGWKVTADDYLQYKKVKLRLHLIYKGEQQCNKKYTFISPLYDIIPTPGGRFSRTRKGKKNNRRTRRNRK